MQQELNEEPQGWNTNSTYLPGNVSPVPHPTPAPTHILP